MVKKYFIPAAKVLAVLGFLGLAFAFYFQMQNASNRGKNLRTKATQFEQLLPYFNVDWAKDTFWDDGLSEIVTYTAADKSKVVYITKKEVFCDEFHVRNTDSARNDLYDVIKVNERAIGTDSLCPISSLNSMAFIRMNPFMLHKLMLSYQDVEGTSFKEIDLNQGILQMTYHTYAPKEGTGEFSFGRNMLVEDQLMYSLRSLRFAPGLSFKGNVLETQVSPKKGDLLVYRSLFTVKEGGDIPVNGVSFPCWEVKVQLGADKFNTYYFTKNYPNLCVKRSTWDGRDLTIAKVLRTQE